MFSSPIDPNGVPKGAENSNQVRVFFSPVLVSRFRLNHLRYKNWGILAGAWFENFPVAIRIAPVPMALGALTLRYWTCISPPDKKAWIEDCCCF